MDGRPPHTITKSRYLQGRQCLKYLWIAVHERERIPAPDEAAQFRFDEGYRIDRLAKSLWPDGREVAHDDFLKNLEETQALLAARVPLFEAGFKAGDLAARPDILLPAGGGAWDVVEVKSAAEVKEVNVLDVSFQRLCYERAGLKIRSCSLMHVNTTYVRRGEIETGKLLVREDISGAVDEMLPETEAALGVIRRALRAKTCPRVDIGRQCTDPYQCPLIYHCWAFLPEENVFDLYNGREKPGALMARGVLSLKDIPDDFALTDKQSIQRNCARTGKPHVEIDRLRAFLDGLNYPLSYLDFETCNPAVPRYDGVRPYQVVPFQFSLHVQRARGGKTIHRSFLAEGEGDPRPAFLESLLEALPETGGIVVYNQWFEKAVLKSLAEFYPDHEAEIEGLLSRFVDLLDPFRAFHYYHPRQRGSASLKRVLPAVTDRGYEGMPIADGLAAARAFLRLAFGPEYGYEDTEKERKEIRRRLEAYCGLDTEGMVWIVRELERMAEG